jgi:hypothetical protein
MAKKADTDSDSDPDPELISGIRGEFDHKATANKRKLIVMKTLSFLQITVFPSSSPIPQLCMPVWL